MSGYDRGRRDDYDRGGRRDDYDRDRSSHRDRDRGGYDDRRGKRISTYKKMAFEIISD